MSQKLQRVLHLPRRIVREALMVFHVVQFALRNHLSHDPITRSGGPIVSLTTFGARASTAYFALESIACGTVRPSRLMLWIDEETVLANLPGSIRRLERRGLEVKRCHNYGPHEKYYPYVESQDTFDAPLVTADDDMIYPKYWLQKLAAAYRQHPECVNCFWGHVMELDQNRLRPFAEWQQVDSTRPSYRHHAAGVTGVIYPPALLGALKQAGTMFKSCCPKADDIWLHVQALRHGYKIRPIVPRLPYYSFRGIPGTQTVSLCSTNVDGDGNDLQITATYTDADIALLHTE